MERIDFTYTTPHIKREVEKIKLFHLKHIDEISFLHNFSS